MINMQTLINIQNNDKHTVGTTGVYTVKRGDYLITVRAFEAPELMIMGQPCPMMAAITYRNMSTGETRQELDQLSNAQKEHCSAAAEKWGGRDELYKARFANAYWELIK